MGPTFRDARPEDAAAIAALHQRAGEAAYRGVLPDELLDELTADVRARRWGTVLTQGDERCLLLEGDGLLAFAHTSPTAGEDVDEPALTLHALYVDPDRVGTGLGRTLLGELMRRARAEGVREIVLWVLASNDRGIAFYAGNGFVPDGRVGVRENREGGMRALRLRRSLEGVGEPQ